MKRVQGYGGVLFLVVTGMALQTVAAGKHNAVENPFADCDRMLNEAQRSSAGAPGAAAYLNQARQLMNQARSDYYKLCNSLPASQPGSTPGQLQTTDSLGYDLKRDANGRLVPRNLDPAGLAAQAEEWSKQMKEVVGKIDAMRNGDQAALSKDVAEMLKSLGEKANAEDQMTSTPSALSNPYANDPNVVDLRDAKTLTPKLLREDDSTQSGKPLNVDESSPKPYSAMSDEQLEKKKEALTKALAGTQKLSSENVRGFSEVETDATAGKETAWKAVQDAGTMVAFGTLQSASAKDLRVGQEVGDAAIGMDAVNLLASPGLGWLDPKSKIDNGETLATILPMVSGLAVKSSPTLGAVPGVVKLGFDTGLVWADYFLRSEDYARQEQRREQLDANRLYLSRQQKEIIEEQNRRKAANSQK